MSKKRLENKSTAPVIDAPKRVITSAVATAPIKFRDNSRFVVLIFFLLSFVLYGQSIWYDYVLDDQIVITDNRFTKKGFAGIKDLMSKESFVGYFGEQRDLVAGARYRPLSLVTFAIEWELFAPDETKLPKLQPNQKRDYSAGAEFATVRKVHHFVNIFLYFISAVLLFRFLELLFPKKDDDEKWYFNIPFVTALLFLLHPIHVEAVANIKGRDEILSFIGIFATLYYCLRYEDSKKVKYILFSIITFFLGMLAKENTVTLLGIIPLTMYCFRKKDVVSSLMSIIPIFGVFLFYLLIRYGIIGYILSSGKEITDIMNNPFADMAIGERLATVFYTLGRYILLLFAPHPLTHDYYPYQIPKMKWSDWESIVSLLGYVALLAYSIYTVLKNRSRVGYAILFFMVTLFIVSNLPFSVGTFMNDRFIYTSSVGFCLLLAYLFVDFLGKKQVVIGLALMTLLGLGYAAKTFTRVPDWRSTMSLNTSAIQVSPNSARANLFYGVALFNEATKYDRADPQRKENMYKALPYVEKAIQILPSYGSAMHMASGIDAEIYQYDNDLDKILNKYASYLRYRRQLTIEDIATNSTFIDKYLVYFEKFPQYKPQLMSFYSRVCKMFVEELKDGEMGVRYCSNALRVDPGNLEISALMGKAQQIQNSSKNFKKK
jgi:protein O-mannosyl-transferase